MNIEQVGSFRTRPTGDGSLEVWARGWRLDSPLYALIPAGLALLFVLSPMPITMRIGGAVVMLAAALFVFRLTKPGLLLSADAVTIVGVVQTHRFAWDSVSGFMGERRHDEGRILLVLDDERRVPLPGTLDPGELDPYGEEGEMLSAVDQLNRLGERARSGQVAPSVARPAEFIAAPPVPPPSEGASRSERRAERKQLKAALKAVRLPADGSPAKAPAPAAAAETSAPARRSWRRKKEEEPAEELTKVAIAEPEPPAGPPRRQQAPAPASTPSHFPTPTYIPQEEYARMLREQKAAEKAAAAAAAELRELADLDELGQKEEFSDWEK